MRPDRCLLAIGMVLMGLGLGGGTVLAQDDGAVDGPGAAATGVTEPAAEGEAAPWSAAEAPDAAEATASGPDAPEAREAGPGAVATGAEEPNGLDSLTSEDDLLLRLGLEQWVQIEWVRRILAAVIALILTAIAYRVLLGLLRRIGRSHPNFEPLQDVLVTVLRWLIWPIGVLFALSAAGLNLGGVWAVVTASLALVAIGLVAVWSMLSNLFAALLIVGTRHYRTGQEVEFITPQGGSGCRGRVATINLWTTWLEEVKDSEPTGALIKIPNNVVMQQTLRIHPARKGGDATREEVAAVNPGNVDSTTDKPLDSDLFPPASPAASGEARREGAPPT